MKTRLLKLLLLPLLLITFLISSETALGQTVVFTGVKNNLTSPTTLSSGQSQVVLAGFTAQVTGSVTFKQFNITWTGTNSVQTCLTNATLYRTPTNSFQTGNPGVPVGNVTLNGTNITVTNLSETINNTTNNYYLVADVIYSNVTTDYNEQVTINNATFGVDINNVGYAAYISYATAWVFSGGITPYALSINNQSNSLSANTSTITSGTSGLVMYNFSIKNNSLTSYTFSEFNINSTVADITKYFTGFKLFVSADNSTTKPSTSTITGSGSGAYVTFTGLSQTLGAGVTRNYWLVADCSVGSGATLPGSIQFSFLDGQSTPAIKASSPAPAKNFNTATAIGNVYTVNSATVTVTTLTGGVTSGTLTPKQSSVVLCGFSVAASSTISVSAFNINSTNTAASYFKNGILYRCNGTNYTTATSKIPVGTVTFNGTYANVAFSTAESITSSTTNQNYFLVADNSGGAASSTIQFNFTSGQGTSAIVQSSPVVSNYNTVAMAGNSLTLPAPTLILNGANSTTTNGITQGSLTYGQNNIVLFGFSAEAFGSNISLTNIRINTPTGTENGYFTNGSIYRSTTPLFPGGTPAYTNISIPGGTYGSPATVSETIPAGTTYYYFFTADYTVASGAATTNFAFTLNTGQITSSPATTGSYAITGNGFTIATAEYWTGAVDNDFAKAGNFTKLDNSPGVVPGVNMVVNIGGKTVTTPPTIKATTTIGGITFSATSTTVTINSGVTLTMNTGLTVSGAKTAEFTGPGDLVLASSSTSNIGSGATLNLSGATDVTNNGVVIMAPTSVLNFAGNATMNTTGTNSSFTLASDATGSASVGKIPTGSSFAGNVNVQRYMSGGSTARSYRLLSSPVFTTTFTSPAVRAYYLYFLQATTPITGWGATGVYSATQPSIGNFDLSATGNPSALFYYEPDADPPSKALTVSDYKGFGSTTDFIPIGNGFLFFFRGNRNALSANGVGKTATGSVPENTTMNNYGVLNQGDVQVYIPTAPLVTYSGTTKKYVQAANATDLSLNFSYTSKTPASDGLHLVGNPYPCTIDLDKLTSTLFTNPYSSTNNLVYMLNNTGVFGTYKIGSGVSNNGVGRYVSQGQGFFVRAGTGGNSTLTFTEDCKVTSGFTAPTAFAIAANGKPAQALHVTLNKDSIIKNETVVLFGSANTSTKYSDQEDAYYMSGPSQTVFMASYSSDNTPCILNEMGKIDSVKTVSLLVDASTTGRYSLSFDGANTIDPRFKAYLKDNLLKDSLDLTANKLYEFNIDRNDSKTYGSTRFSLVFYPTHIADRYNLISFNGTKKATGVDLTWKTQNEGDYTGFTVQRSVDNWKTSVNLGSLQSDGSGLYNFTDTKPVTNTVNQYKLAQNNIDNVTTLSNAIAFSYLTVNIDTKKLSVYPNPVISDIKIDIKQAIGSGALQVKVFNIRGEMVKNTTFEPTGALNLSVDNLMHGTYVIQVSDNNTTYGSTTFTKQ